jgi:hypothetical protein
MTLTCGGNSVVIGANLLPCDGIEVIHSQNRIVTEDGVPIVYNRGVTAWMIPIKVRVTNTLRASIRTFFQTHTQWSAQQIVFTPDTGWDVGDGSNTVNTYLWQDSYKEKPYNTSLYDIEFVLRSYSVGTANPS